LLIKEVILILEKKAVISVFLRKNEFKLLIYQIYCVILTCQKGCHTF